MNPITNFCSLDYVLTLILLVGILIGWEANRRCSTRLGHALIALSAICPILLHLVVYSSQTELTAGSTFARIRALIQGCPSGFGLLQFFLILVILLYISMVCFAVYVVFRLDNSRRAKTTSSTKTSPARKSKSPRSRKQLPKS